MSKKRPDPANPNAPRGGSDASDPALYVPMALQALVVNDHNQNDDFTQVSPRYQFLSKDTRLGEPLNRPFFDGKEKPGVHLHWILPAALTQGRQEEQDQPVFPPVPDRWAIVRTLSDGKAVQSTRSWVLFSNALLEKPLDGQQTTEWPALRDWLQGRGSAAAIHKHLGMWIEVTDGQTSVPSTFLDQPLTAVGDGQPSFAAFYPSCRTVFGFRDQVEQDPDYVEGMLASYSVVGWFSNTANDPLATEAQDLWEKVPPETDDSTFYWWLPELGWRLPTDEDLPSDVPHRTLCQGQLSGVDPANRDSAVPDPASIEVAAGNTVAEAMAAYIGKGDPAEAALLEAFQNHLLDQYGSEFFKDEVAMDRHSRSFRRFGGDPRWTIRRQLASGADGDPLGLTAAAGQETAAAVPKSYFTRLAALNTSEAKLSSALEDLRALRQELFSAWYFTVLKDPDKPFEAADFDKFVAEIKSLTEEVADLETQRDGRRQELKEAIEKHLAGWELALEVGDTYWQPNEPVLLMAHAGRSSVYQHQSPLQCRFELVKALTITIGQRTRTIDVADIRKYFPALPDSVLGIPLPQSDLVALYDESFLLGSTMAGPMAEVLIEKYSLDPNEFDNIKISISNLQKSWQPGRSKKPFNGCLPEKLAVANWAAPWNPLIMEWRGFLYPSYVDPKDALENWSLDGNALEWRTDKDPVNDDQPYVEGQILLSSAASNTLEKRLSKYIEEHGGSLPKEEKKELEDIAKRLGQLDVLTQGLSGFNEGLLLRQIGLQLIPLDFTSHETQGQLTKTITDHIADAGSVAPLWPKVKVDAVTTPRPFNPIRAGHLQISDLWLVDAFGQTAKIVEGPTGSNPNYEEFKPIRSETLITPYTDNGQQHNKSLIQLAPRLTQPARLHFDWVSATDDKTPSTADPATSPLIAWMVPNHLDRELWVYDGQGLPLGVLRVGEKIKCGTGVTSRQTVFVPAPGGGEVRNPHLGDLIHALTETPLAETEAFTDLLYILDESLGATASPSNILDTSLAVLTGRPIAVARAAIDITLLGKPTVRPNPESFDPSDWNSDGFEKVPMPVRLGSDVPAQEGLLAYFEGDDYKRCYVRPNAALPTGSSFLVAEHHLQVPATGTPQPLTVLLEPRGEVHAQTPILPTEKLTLPPAQVEQVIQALDVLLPVTPLISAKTAIEIPLSKTLPGHFSWRHFPRPGEVQKKVTIAPPQLNPSLEGAQRVHEGWLNLSQLPPDWSRVSGNPGWSALPPTSPPPNLADGLVVPTTAAIFGPPDHPYVMVVSDGGAWFARRSRSQPPGSTLDWQVIDLPQNVTPRVIAGGATTTLGERLLAYGLFIDDNGDPLSFEIDDPSTPATWKRLAAPPWLVMNGLERTGFQVVTVAGAAAGTETVLALGGSAGQAYYQDIWTSTDGTHWTQAPDAPWSPRRQPGLGAVTAAGASTLYLVGGFAAPAGGSGDRQLKDVWSSNDGITWKPAQAPPWKGRYQPLVLQVGDSLWAMGGFRVGEDHMPRSQTDIWMFDGRDNWQQSLAALPPGCMDGLESEALSAVLNGLGLWGYDPPAALKLAS